MREMFQYPQFPFMVGASLLGHPLDSWSKYPSVVNAGDLNYARNILRRGADVNQMMKVIGEEGTSLDDFIIYLKSEFLDYVYLQQNTFDAVDGATSAERQRIMFDDVTAVLKDSFQFEDKESARTYFLELRQLFLDRNYDPPDSDDYRNLSDRIKAKIAEGKKANA